MAQNEVDNKVWQEDLNLLAKDEIFKSFSNSSILITGATGLIGSELVFSILCANRLNNLNIKIYALVRNENKAKEIFKNVLDNPNFNLIIQDITSNIQIEEKIDYVIHCANITNSKIMVEKPAEVVDVTINGIKNVLEFAKKNDIKSVLYLSSIEIYGENVSNKIDIKEDDYGFLDFNNVRNCYPLSKKMAEKLCLFYSDDYGVDVKIARLTQTFGAGISKDENRIFAQIAKAIIKNEDIVLKTDGLSAKNYCYITDTISALLTILSKGQSREIYNVANYDSFISIKDLALKMIDKYQSSKLVFDVKDNAMYPKNSKLKLNSSKLEALGWCAKVGLDDMFERLINYLKEEN